MGTRCNLVLNGRKLYAFAKKLIPKGRGKDWNYAMFDLGATLCTARNHSEKCPLAQFHGKVADFQHRRPQKRFAGSNRFYRGRMLFLLKNQKEAAISALSQYLLKTPKETRAPVLELMSDRLVTLVCDKVFLPR